MKLKFWHVAFALGLGWVLIRSTRPKWYEDLMLRAFAADQFADPGKTKEQKEQFEKAADLAARALLPMGWVLRIVEVASGTTAEQAVGKVQAWVLKAGPPADTQPATLADYKAKALAAGGVV